MTIFDVLAFKMVTALASSTATVTASDWSAVVDAMTGQISVSTFVATLAVFVGAVIGIVFMWWGVRKAVRTIMAAFRKGKVSV